MEVALLESHSNVTAKPMQEDSAGGGNVLGQTAAYYSRVRNIEAKFRALLPKPVLALLVLGVDSSVYVMMSALVILPLALIVTCIFSQSKPKEGVETNKNLKVEYISPPETEVPSSKERSSTAEVSTSVLLWGGITSFQLIYTFVNSLMALFVLPMEAERLNANDASIWVGAYLAVCGLTQLACPIVGKISDRHCSSWGRRRPFIVVGTAGALVSFAVMWVASSYLLRWAFIISLFFAQLSVNVVFSAQVGLPADLLGTKDQRPGEEASEETSSKNMRGIVSGLVAMQSFVGSLLAMLIIVTTRRMSVQVNYPLIMIGMFATCWLVCISAKEPRTDGDAEKTTQRASLTMSEIVASFTIDLVEDRDFFWVCAGRLCYYVSTSVVVFLYYYIRDMIHIEDEATRRSKLAALVVVAQLCGAVFTVPCGQLSNAVGRKPVIYASCLLMSSAFLLFIVAPLLQVSYAWTAVLATGFVYGLGSGAYMSVDYALALDCLPRGKTSAEAFGLWGVAGFAGSTIGPVVGGLLLDMGTGGHSASSSPATYSYLGYCLVMCYLGCFMTVIVAIVTSMIKKVH